LKSITFLAKDWFRCEISK